METITVEELHKQMQQNKSTVLIDVRTPSEYADVHITGARLYPITEFNPEGLLEELKGIGHKDEKIYVVCRGGPRSETACELLRKAECGNTAFVEGGTDAWVEAGYPVIRSQQALSLERQFQLVIGTIILLGTLLGLTLNVLFYLLPLAIGAGLIYSGYSGSCMLMHLLGKMPWNARD